MKAFLYRACAIIFSHFVLYPDYRISFFIPLAFRFADYKECYRIASEVFFRVNAGILVVKGKERYLKSNEACLLKLLCRKMGTVVKIEELYAGIWGKAILFDSKDKALRNLVSELRKTLEGTGLEIRNKRFAGYCLKGE